jgi:hypothetical protein
MNLPIITEILKRFRNEKFIEELLYAIYNEQIMFNPGFSKSKSEIENLYALRLKIAKEINRDKFKDDEINIWEEAIIKLTESKEETIHLTWIDSESKFYLLFLTQDLSRLIAFFWLNSKTSIKEKEDHNDEIIKKGHSSSAVKYNKGVREKEWNNVG